MKLVVTTLLACGLWACGCAAQPLVVNEADIGPLVIFHNSSGPMCLAALDWLDRLVVEHPALVIEQHLTYEPGVTELLAELEAQTLTSQGVSTSFEYLPIVFFQENAFSGFNNEIAETLEELVSVGGELR